MLYIENAIKNSVNIFMYLVRKKGHHVGNSVEVEEIYVFVISVNSINIRR